LIVRWSGQFLFFVFLRQFSQVVGEWLENQILIPDWTYFYCPGTTLVKTHEFGGVYFHLKGRGRSDLQKWVGA